MSFLQEESWVPCPLLVNLYRHLIRDNFPNLVKGLVILDVEAKDQWARRDYPSSEVRTVLDKMRHSPNFQHVWVRPATLAGQRAIKILKFRS